MPPLPILIDKVRAAGITLPDGRIRIDSYGDSAALSASLLALIRQGPKRAGTSLWWSHEAEGEDIPQVGDIQIVVDHRDEPALLTRVTRVEVLPFDAVGAGYAAIEGEGDGSLDHWRRVHWDFFTRECEQLGREPTPDMLVVCCVFELLATLPAAA